MSLKRKLGFESLESRRVCAGNVTAKVLNGTLTITGDGNHNYIEVQQAVIGGETKFVVTGRNYNGSLTLTAGVPTQTGPATAINGGVAPARLAATKLSINMRGGNDVVILGKGTTASTLIDVNALNVVMGTHSDFLRVTNVRVDTAAKAVLDMTGVGGTSTVGQGEIGTDTLQVSRLTLVGTNLEASTGGGDDKITASNLISNALVTLFAGTGLDSLKVSASKFKNVNVSMGPASTTGDAGDTVSVTTTTATNVTVNMGDGANDVLSISSTKVSTSTNLNGGAGLGDRLTVGSGVDASGLSVIGFEIKPQGT